MKKFALMALVLTVAAVAAQAVPTVTLTATTTGTVWKVWATVSNDCAGLSSFQISFGGTGEGAMGTVVSSTQKAANFYDGDYGAIIGFASSFKSNGTVADGAVTDIINGQGTAYGDTPDSEKDALVIQGCGITAHGVMNVGGDTQLGTIATPFLLAQGTISGTLPLKAGVGAANVLVGSGGSGWSGPGNVTAGTVVFGDGFTPEPTTLALLAIGGIAALRRRR